jgi:hypothetical protein
VNVHVDKFIGYDLRVVVGQKLGYGFVGCDFDHFVGIFGECDEYVGEQLLFCVGEYYELRYDFDAGFPDAPDGLLAFLEEEELYDFLVEELFADVAGDGVRVVDDLAFDADAGVFVHLEVVCAEEGFGLLRRHVRGHHCDQVDRYNLAFLVLALLQFQRQSQHLLPLLACEFVCDLGEQDAAFLAYLCGAGGTSRWELLMSLMRGSMKRCWKSVRALALGRFWRRY